MRKISGFKKQKGSVIVISMMFLIGLSMIAISAMKSGNLNLKIISNENAKNDLRYKIALGLEQLAHDGSQFVIDGQDLVVDGQLIVLEKDCLFSQTATGYGANFNPVGGDIDNGTSNIAPQDTIWRITANATASNGTTAGAIQGIKMKMLSGVCS